MAGFGPRSLRARGDCDCGCDSDIVHDVRWASRLLSGASSTAFQWVLCASSSCRGSRTPLNVGSSVHVVGRRAACTSFGQLVAHKALSFAMSSITIIIIIIIITHLRLPRPVSPSRSESSSTARPGPTSLSSPLPLPLATVRLTYSTSSPSQSSPPTADESIDREATTTVWGLGRDGQSI